LIDAAVTASYYGQRVETSCEVVVLHACQVKSYKEDEGGRGVGCIYRVANEFIYSNIHTRERVLLYSTFSLFIFQFCTSSMFANDVIW
jgi:hypothetical protein